MEVMNKVNFKNLRRNSTGYSYKQAMEDLTSANKK